MRNKGFVSIVALAALASAAAAQEVSGADSATGAEAAFDVHDLEVAGMPFVARPIDLAQKSDPIWFTGDQPKANMIAKVTLAPLGAVVVDKDFGQGAGKKLVLSLAVTGDPSRYATTADVAAETAKRLYCANGSGPGHAGRVLCLLDKDRDGRFEAKALGLGEKGGAAEQLSILGAPMPLPEPVAYRQARPDEMPVIAVSYSNCGKDHDRPRYAFSTQTDGKPGISLTELTGMTPGAVEAFDKMKPEQRAQLVAALARVGSGAPCGEARPMAPGDPDYPANLAKDAAAVRMGDLIVEIGPKSAGAPVRLIAQTAPDRLYRLNGMAVEPMAQTVTARQNQLAIRQKFDKPVIMTTGGAEVAEGEAKAGDIVLKQGISHGYMGVLTQDTVIRTLFSKRSLPKGTLLYGMPMSSRTVMTRYGVLQGNVGTRAPSVENTRLVWCVPVQDEEEWSATCLPEEGGQRYTLLKGQKPAFEVTGLSYAVGTSSNEGPVPVTPQAGDFGKPLAYWLRIKEIGPDAIVLTQETRFGDELVHSREHRVPRIAGETSGLSWAGGALLFGAVEGAADRIAIGRKGAFAAGVAPDVKFGLVREPGAGAD